MIKRIDVREQIAEKIELGGDLGAADDGRDRTLRCVQRFLQRFELLLHGAAGIGGEEMGDRFDGGMRPVRDREGVIDIDVAEPREPGGKGGIVLFFALVEAGILQAQNVAGLHRRDGFFGDVADAIVGKCDRPADDARDRGDDRLQRFLRIAAFRPAVMRQQDHLAAAVGDFDNGRRVAFDARYVRHLAVLHRHVEVDAHEHALALYVGVVESAKAHGEQKFWQ